MLCLKLESSMVLHSLIHPGLSSEEAEKERIQPLRGWTQRERQKWKEKDVKNRRHTLAVCHKHPHRHSIQGCCNGDYCITVRGPQSFNSLWTRIRFPAAAPAPYVGKEALGKSWVLKGSQRMGKALKQVPVVTQPQVFKHRVLTEQ